MPALDRFIGERILNGVGCGFVGYGSYLRLKAVQGVMNLRLNKPLKPSEDEREAKPLLPTGVPEFKESQASAKDHSSEQPR